MFYNCVIFVTLNKRKRGGGGCYTSAADIDDISMIGRG